MNEDDRMALELLPDVPKASNAHSVENYMPKIEELVELLEASHTALRERWPNSEDPERLKIEWQMYHVSSSRHALRELLKVLK